METIYLSYPNHLKKEEQRPTVMALGFFDGVHYGHRQVIQTSKNEAIQRNVDCSVMTFYPHPKEVLGKYNEEAPLRYITPLDKKIELIESLNVDRLYIVKFDKELSKLTPQQFVDDYLIQLNVVHVVAGFDYSYGHLGRGTMETLPFHSRKHFSQTTVRKVEKDTEKISSTLIRQNILDGKMDELVDLLGRPYEIEGEVIHGEKRGRQIGFPTANIGLTLPYLIPKTGVYAILLNYNGNNYQGVCNIGYKPTFHKDRSEGKSIEAHLFDFNGDLYDKSVKITFLKYLREEKKFSSVDELVQQINEDKEQAIKFFIQN